MWHQLRAIGGALCCAMYMATEGDKLHATVTFQFTYFDAAGVGFNDAAVGPARRAALESVAADIGSMIGQTATVQIGIAPTEFDGTDFIGIASQTNLNTAPPAAGIFDGEVYRRIVLGMPDVSPALDAGMAFDFGYAPALSGVPAPGQAYFPDVARDELTHLLGYASQLRADGTGLNGTSPDVYYRFDTFVKTSGGESIITPASSLAVSPLVYASAYAAGLVFDGPATRAANGGVPLPLYFASPTHSKLPDDVMFVSPAVGYARDAWSARYRGPHRLRVPDCSGTERLRVGAPGHCQFICAKSLVEACQKTRVATIAEALIDAAR